MKMKKIERKLNDLREYGEERVRLTKHLQKVLAEVAEAIASPLEEGASVQVGKYRIFVKEYQSNIGSYKTLTISDTESDTEAPEYDYMYDGEVFCKPFGRAITDIALPGNSRYLHGDFHCVVTVASRQEFLFFANHLEEVIKSFQAEQEKIVDVLRRALMRLDTID